MSIKYVVTIIIGFISIAGISQQDHFSSLSIPDHLTKNANAVLRIDNTKIEISSIKNLKHSYRRVVTILNERGNDYLKAYVGYDNEKAVRKLSAIIYNKFGMQLKKFKKSDFKDVAAVSSFSLYEDNRVKYLEYTPIEYPYTVDFYYETETSNTAWIPFWRPMEGYYISTQNSSFEVLYDESIGLNSKEKNFLGYNIVNESKEGGLRYIAKDLKAIKSEQMSPKFNAFSPGLHVSTKKFHYDGYTGTIDNWTNLGKWINDKLLAERDRLPEATINKIKDLVKDAKTPLEKAKIVYQFVQDNTRYISVQVGIGGIQPIAAADVDKVKYGDCKGLTNYTKALLNAVGVKSYYAEVYASSRMQLSIDKEFASLLGQANHVILNLPQENGNKDVWLECTNQQVPFGFLGDFTDDRDVLVITPEGGVIKHTTKYATKENSQFLTGRYTISSSGNIVANVEVHSKGIQYDDKYIIDMLDDRERDLRYKNRWNYINAISIDKIEIDNNKDSIQFNESLSFKASNYSKKVGSNRMLVTLNALNRLTDIPNRYRRRSLPVKILRGFVDVDEVEISLPIDYYIEALPNNVSIDTEFGNYNVEISKKSETELIYKRHFTVFEGEYSKEEYEKFRDFYKTVSRLDNTKIALIRK